MHFARLITPLKRLQDTQGTCLLVAVFLLLIPFSALSIELPHNAPKIDPEVDGEFSAFDFHVGGRYVGLAYGFFGDHWIALENAADILPLLPPVRNKQALLPLISGVITGPRQIKHIGTLRIDINNFKIYLEVAQALSFTSDVSDMEALPKPKKILALRNKVILTGSTSFNVDNGQGHGSLNHNTLFGRGRTRINSIGTYNEATGSYEVSAASVNRDLRTLNQHMTLSSGLLETSGQQFAGSLSILGVRLGSNRILINRDPLLKASRIEIYTPTRSRIDIFRAAQNSGRLLYSNIFDFGTSEIDTRSFPQGTYNIEIVITNNKGDIKRETRPFTKTTHLALRAHPEILFELGTIRDKIKFTDQAVGLISVRKRLLDWADGSASFYSSADASIIEANSNIAINAQALWLPGDIKSNVNIAISQRGLLGTSTYLDWNNQNYSGRLSLSKSFNRILLEGDPAHPSNNDELGETSTSTNNTSLNSTALNNTELNQLGDEVIPETPLAAALSLQARESVNLNLSGPIQFKKLAGRLLINCNWSQNEGQPADYHFGPQLTFNVFKSPRFQSSLKLQWIFNKDNDANFFLSFSSQSKQSKTPKQAQLNFRNNASGYTLGGQLSVSAPGNNASHPWRKNIDARSTLYLDDIVSEHQSIKVSLDNSLQYSGKLVSTNTYVNTNLNTFSGHFGGEVSSTLIWNEEGLLAASGQKMSQEKAILVVKVIGEGSSRFSFLVNRGHKGFIHAGEQLIIPLPTYKTSTIKLADRGDEPVLIETPERTITAYPGNIFEAVFYFKKMLLVFGRLLDQQGEPVVNQRFISPGGVSYTDEDGYFDIETPVAKGGALIIEMPDRRCVTTLKGLVASDIFFEAGDIRCD
ncbi:MAG: hypothetical protein COB04_10890 [Gammaproteobacteria bacterium]|nr:MAG: hypothetical protein COB04_10890 [Gammaproteobacteria bacterium]